MQLTLQSDYTLRVLIYISYHQDKIVTIEEIANFYEISAHHLTRIIHKLGELGYIYTIRGKGGGFRLAKTPSEINIGELIEKIESHFNIVECFDPTKKRCKILGPCLLKPLLADAMQKFIDTLKQKTLADLVINNNRLKNLITKS
ncbi:RrF2 family transcriptional regulator [Pigmentibacter ruber]|uniref:RrF2 family transcriptional regulator n=1 Tax=Pigmentibacter ruber TaxID=2683196 RepID=UPI00131B6667|nr:Rrf2 family transcriptional regulator [Pigmentibacter ruber]